MLGNDIKYPHLGYYVYDNQAFLMREEALDLMLLKKDYGGKIEFYYNDHIFSNINWEKNVHFDISALYRVRAQQLRDKYNYLILRYSGGSDSTQALESFIKNGIFLDEIIVIMHEKAIKNLDRNMMVIDTELSQYLEYEYAVIPQLKRVKKLSPNTKITLLDSSDNLFDQLVNKKFQHLGRNDEPTSLRNVTTGLAKSWTPLLFKHEEESSTRDGVAVIRGLEKPVIDITDDGKIFFVFYDITLCATVSVQKKGTSYTIEDFYWSPDFPLIPVKQVHMIIEKLSTNEKLYNEWKSLRAMIKRVNADPSIKSSPGYILDRWYNTIIYPDWNPTIYVAPKSTEVTTDFKLLDALGIDHQSQQFYDEYIGYKKKKYDKIINKQQLSKFMFSRPYYVGQFQPNFRGAP